VLAWFASFEGSFPTIPGVTLLGGRPEKKNIGNVLFCAYVEVDGSDRSLMMYRDLETVPCRLRFQLPEESSVAGEVEYRSHQREVDARAARTGAHVVHLRSPGPRDPRCGHCGVKAGRSRCSRCRQVYYCNVHCQSEDWAKHRSGCASRVA